MSRHVDEHISRCIELYGQVGMEDVELRKKSVDRSSYEQMRSDLMVAIGMLMATVPKAPENTSRSAF